LPQCATLTPQILHVQCFSHSANIICLPRPAILSACRSNIAVHEIPGHCYMMGSGASGGSNGFWSNWTEPTGERRYTYGVSDAFTKTVKNQTLSAGLDLVHMFCAGKHRLPSHSQCPIRWKLDRLRYRRLHDGQRRQFHNRAEERSPASRVG